MAKGSHLLDDEVTVRIHPRKIIKGIILLLLFVVVFFLGWASASTIDCSSDDVSEQEESQGWFSDLFSGFEMVQENVSADVVLQNESNITVTNSSINVTNESALGTDGGSLTGDAVSQEAESDSAEEVISEDTVVTTYSDVSISIDKTYKEWKGTWGKIKGFDMTIKNGEVGRIKPSYVNVHVAGYDEDMLKKGTLMGTATNVGAGESVTTDFAVSGGYAYSPNTLGSLNAVEVTLTLFDASDKEMATIKKKLDLNGD